MTVNKVEWLGDFVGCDYDEESLDAVLAHSLNRGDLETSRSLFSSKWWDYRFCHPGYGFFLYAHHFAQATTAWRTKFGVNPYVKLKVSDHPLWRTETFNPSRSKTRLSAPSEIVVRRVLSPAPFRTGLWRGMCFADEYGVPYDRWINLAFDHAFDCTWQHMPMPHTLYGTQMVDTILRRWEEEKVELMRSPADPRFLAKNYEGHPWQRAYQDELLDRIKARATPFRALGQMISEGRVVESLASSVLGPGTLLKAQEYASTLIVSDD